MIGLTRTVDSDRNAMRMLSKIVIRYFSVASGGNKTTTTATAVASTFAKPFRKIPGPRGPFGLGNLYQYLPLIGSYSWLELHKAGRDKYDRYGAIVRETMVPGEDIVWLYDPHDIALLLNERDHPQRRSHLALAKYRQDRPHIYRSAGLLPTNGADWWRLRSELQKEISAPKNVRSFLADVDKVTLEFVTHLHSQPVEGFDALPHLARLNLELTCLLTFDERLNSFAPEEFLSNSRSSRLMCAAETTNANILPTDQGLQLWRRFETPAFKRLRKAQEYMEGVAVDLVSQKLAYFKESSAAKNPTNIAENTGADSCKSQPLTRSSLVEEYLKNPNLDLSDVVGMAADLLLAGIDTTSYTTSFALYHIARNREVQEKLYVEAESVLERGNCNISTETLRTEIPYTRAVLKEVFRLNPISVGVGRILNRDLVFSGYHVPKGTVVVTQNMVACRLERNFSHPLRFSPDRWLQQRAGGSSSANVTPPPNPYLVLPFGHGARACVARRMAEQNILVLLLRLIHNFEIVWIGREDTELDVRTLLINKPSEPVHIRLKTRI